MQCDSCGAALPVEARFCLSCGTRVEQAAPDTTVDPVLEALRAAIGFQYRIERLLGRGGMGAVYLAHEFALDRDVAIKVLPPEHAGTSEVRERFKREARTAARLSHSNIVPLHTFGEVSGLLYFVMGYVAGESLAARLHRLGPMDSEATRALLAPICDALDYAHRRNIVHRDLKPDNILINADSGAPLLTDFGIAKAMRADAQLTTAGQLIGTPHYMSPEQALGRADVGPPSDLYSLGIVAYEMLSGRRPFEAATPLEALTERLRRDAKPVNAVAAGIDPDLASAIARCLQREPVNRWPDAKSLREALLPSEEEAEDSLQWRMLRIWVTMLLLLLLASGHLAIFAALHPGSEAFRRVRGMTAGPVVMIAVLIVAAAIWLRVSGIPAGDIARKALQQPRWWRSWYPRWLRRRGDVWDRLPRPVRHFRVCLGVCQISIPVIIMPQYLALVWSRSNAALWLLPAIFFVLALMFATRRRALKHVAAASGANAEEASKIVSTATWRVSLWRRPAFTSVLRGRPGTASPADGGFTRDADATRPEVDVTHRAATATRTDLDATRGFDR